MSVLYDFLNIDSVLRKYAETVPHQSSYTIVEDQANELCKTTFWYSTKKEVRELTLFSPRDLSQLITPSQRTVLPAPLLAHSSQPPLLLLIRKIVWWVMTPLRWIHAAFCRWTAAEVARKEVILDRCLNHFLTLQSQAGWENRKNMLEGEFRRMLNRPFAVRWPFTSPSFLCKKTMIQALFRAYVGYTTDEIEKAIKLAPDDTLRFYARAIHLAGYESLIRCVGDPYANKKKEITDEIQQSLHLPTVLKIRKTFIKQFIRPTLNFMNEYIQAYTDIGEHQARKELNQKLRDAIDPGILIHVLGKLLCPELTAMHFNLAAHILLVNALHNKSKLALHPDHLRLDPESRFRLAFSFIEQAKTILQKFSIAGSEKTKWLKLLEDNQTAINTYLLTVHETDLLGKNSLR